MKRLFFAVLLMLLLSGPLWAEDVKLDWDGVPGAAGYKLSISYDLGATWLAPIDAKLVKPFTITGVPDDKLVLIKVGAYNAAGSVTWNECAFAATDVRRKPLPQPSGPGIK